MITPQIGIPKTQFGYELPSDSKQLASLLNKIFIEPDSEEHRELQEFLKKACYYIKTDPNDNGTDILTRLEKEFKTELYTVKLWAGIDEDPIKDAIILVEITKNIEPSWVTKGDLMVARSLNFQFALDSGVPPIKYSHQMKMNRESKSVRSYAITVACRFRFDTTKLELAHGDRVIPKPDNQVVRLVIPINFVPSTSSLQIKQDF